MCYGVVCSPQQLFPATQRQAKTNLLIAVCLSTWLFHLCNKSGGNLSEIQRMRLPKLRSLTRDFTACNNQSTYVLMPRWCLVPKFFNIILSNLWPLKIKPSNTMLATLLLVYCLEWMLGYHNEMFEVAGRLSISNSAARQLFTQRTVTGNTM